MSELDATRIAIASLLARSRVGLPRAEVQRILAEAGVGSERVRSALERLLGDGLAAERAGGLVLTQPGIAALLEALAALEAALEPARATGEECPSIPWLTAVRTEWIEALSINYAVDPAALRRLIPHPLEPEVFKGRAWVQVLVSSLRDMRPMGLGTLFGVSFYQASYRAAVSWRTADGTVLRGGYFLRSETNHEVMRFVGNALREFQFHEFGAADMVVIRDRQRLTIGVDPDARSPGGRIVGIFDTHPSSAPLAGSRWESVDELFEPLVECYDAFGVDRAGGYVYVLTVDRDPWNARFIRPESLYCEYFAEGPLGAGASALDSVLHVPRCAYRWRPLRRLRFRR